jgi:hypothetical protein
MWAEITTPDVNNRELVLLPDWSQLSAESRAQKLLERIDELEADVPPQRKDLFTCPPEEKLKTGRKMIKYFENEDSNERVWQLKMAGTKLLEGNHD